MAMPTRLGLLTGGGDCPGLNAVIRAVTKKAIIDYQAEVIGFEDGYDGLMTGRIVRMTFNAASGILNVGGTILGTSNKANPFAYILGKKGARPVDRSDEALRIYRKLKLRGLICVGGDGTLTIAHQLAAKGMRIVGVPKTIDNDLSCTDMTFGFDSAVAVATEAIDRLHSTAMSHHRVMMLEVMGRYAGWIALSAGVAGGGDIILIPELPYDLGVVCRVVKKRHLQGKKFSIIVIAEGTRPRGGQLTVKRRVADSSDPIRLGGIANKLGRDIEEQTGLETRATVLGHLQRGGSPTAFDRLLATRFGAKAVELAMAGRFNTMASLRGSDICAVPLSEAVNKIKTVPPDAELIRVARSVGTSFGV